MRPITAALTVAVALCHPRAGAAQDKAPDPALPPAAIARLGEPRFRFDRSYQDFLITPDGKSLLALSDKKVHLCDLATGKEVKSWPNARGHYRLAGITADGAEAATYAQNDRAAVVFRDLTGQKKEQTVKFDLPAFRYVKSAALSPDGRRVAFVVEVQPKNRVWCSLAVADRETGKPLLQIDRTVMHAAAFAPDGKTVAVTAEQYDPDAKARMTSVLLCDLGAGTVRRELGKANEALPKTHRAVAFSKDGKRVASFDPTRKNLSFWEAGNGTEIVPGAKGAAELAADFPPPVRFTAWAAATLKKADDFAIGAGGDVYWPAAITPDGKTVVLRTVNRQPGSLKLADLATRKELPVSAAPAGYGEVHFVAGGSAVLAREWREGWQLWDVKARKAVAAINGQSADDAAKALKRPAALWFEGRFSAGFPPAMPEKLGFKKSGDGWEKVEDAGQSPDGKVLVRRKTTWSNLSGAVPRLAVTYTFEHTVTGKPLAQLNGVSKGGRTLRFSPDSRFLVTTESGGRDLTFVEVASGKAVGVLPGRVGPVFSADNRRAAAADEEKGIYLIDLRSGKTALLAAEDGVAALAFAPDGARLVAGRRDGTILLLDLTALPAKD